ncbi:MAG: FGGY-family carbohydrate kinase [Rhodothermia bacterium]|nr:MAG: FGGY-family carbohydrate kinase [Rhodothermia bacterium]
MSTLFLGIDVGTSFVKTCVFDGHTGAVIGKASFPMSEQRIVSLHPGWAEQDPEMWWEHFKSAYAAVVRENDIDTSLIEAIGISYQMHGLVIVDKDQNVLRDSIIWCDSRATEIGEAAFSAIGEVQCLTRLLNSPGNYTASKLKWVKENEPETFDQIFKFMLPGDYIAMRLSGEITTTRGGLSEGVFWDFPESKLSRDVLDYFEFDEGLFPELVPTIGEQVKVSTEIAAELGFQRNINISYRTGDQSNNALSLNVLRPGYTASTAGTSGVIYSVSDRDISDSRSRVNTVLHVNDSPIQKRNGVMICISGAGSLYRWLKHLLGVKSYRQLNNLAAQAPVGSDGLMIHPFGNGAERIFENRLVNASIQNIEFNKHSPAHIARSGIEGVACTMNLGFEILKSNGVKSRTVRAGYSNLFLSEVFQTAFACLTELSVELYDTDGAEGAARGAALGTGFYSCEEDAFSSLKKIGIVEPQTDHLEQYRDYFEIWNQNLERFSR